jgi:hypothetical protein
MEFLSGLIGAIVGGFFVLTGTFIQGYFQSKEARLHFEQEWQLAAEDHRRQEVKAENAALTDRINEQLVWGDKISVTVARVKYAYSRTTQREERTKELGRLMTLIGVSGNQYSPLSELLEPELLEADELRDLIASHRGKIEDAYLSLILSSDYRPDDLPADEMGFINEVKDLKRRILLRMREMKRLGKPL